MPQKGILSGKGNKVKVLLIVILLLGAFLRVYGLGTESFWLDETDTARSTEFTVPQIIEKTYVDSTIFPDFWGKGAGSVPLYYILVNYWTEIFGLNEFKLRLLSALFGIISIYLIFLLGRFLFDSQVGLISAFILAINHQQIYFSQEARMYGMLVTLTLLSALFLLRALSSNKAAYWAGFAITNAALLYAHYFSFFILFFEGLYVLIYWQKYKKSLKQIFFSAAAIFILYLPWIPALINQLTQGSPIGRFVGGPSISKFAAILIGFNSWISPDLNSRIALRAMNFLELSISGWVLIASVLIVTLLLGSAFIFGLIYLKNRKICISPLKDNRVIFLLLWLSIPVLIPFLISVISPANAIFSDIRYVLFATPAYYLIVALGISKIHKWKIYFLAILVLFSVFPLYSYYINFDTQQWREASDYLEFNRSPNEHLFIQKANNILPLEYYYANSENIITVDTVDQFVPALEGKQSFWLVLALEKYTDPEGLVKAHADSHYRVIQEKEFIGIKIFHYIQPET